MDSDDKNKFLLRSNVGTSTSYDLSNDGVKTFLSNTRSLLSLKVVEQKLMNKGFIRVHKSYIVAKSKIDNMESHEISIKSHRIPISRNHRKTVKEEVLSNHLWKNDNSSSPSDKS